MPQYSPICFIDRFGNLEDAKSVTVASIRSPQVLAKAEMVGPAVMQFEGGLPLKIVRSAQDAAYSLMSQLYCYGAEEIEDETEDDTEPSAKATRAKLPSIGNLTTQRLAVFVTLDTLGDTNATVVNVTSNATREYVLDHIYLLDSQTKPRKAMDVVVDYLDDLLNEGSPSSIDECNAFLCAAKVEKLSDPVLVSFLGITLAAKDMLWSRRFFYDRAKRQVAIRRGDDGAEKLLSRYR